MPIKLEDDGFVKIPTILCENGVGGPLAHPIIKWAGDGIDNDPTREEKVERAAGRLASFRNDMINKGKVWVETPSDLGYIKKY